MYMYVYIYIYTCISRWYPHVQWLLSSPSPIPTRHAAPSPSWRRVASLASDRRIGWWWSGCRRHRGRWRPRIFSSEFFSGVFHRLKSIYLERTDMNRSSMIISKKFRSMWDMMKIHWKWPQMEATSLDGPTASRTHLRSSADQHGWVQNLSEFHQ